MNKSLRTGMDRWWKVLADIRKLWAWMVAAATVPFLAKLAALAPPDIPAIEYITAVFEVVALIVAFQFFEKAAGRTVNKVVGAGVVLFIVSSLIYLVLHSSLIFEIPGTQKLLGVRGFVCLDRVFLEFPDKCPLLTHREIEKANFTAGDLWTPLSMVVARFSLVSAWLSSFFFLSILLGTFVVFHQRATKSAKVT